MLKQTIVYIDGFNLYFGALKGTPYRWLDLDKLCSYLLPQNVVTHFRYFSARVSARPNDPDAPMRQETYWRALRSIPHLEIYQGHFSAHVKSMPVAKPRAGHAPTVKVISTQEKGSDVNLAAHLLMDAFKGRFDVAVVISNDSDLITPIRMVREEFKKTVGILNPYENPSKDLFKLASFYKPIRQNVLQLSQFPVTMKDSRGEFHKPMSW